LKRGGLEAGIDMASNGLIKIKVTDYSLKGKWLTIKIVYWSKVSDAQL